MVDSENDEVHTGQHDRGEEHRRAEGLVERRSEAVTAAHDQDADPDGGPDAKRQPVSPPRLQGSAWYAARGVALRTRTT